jgi:hypothetical protein
MPDEELNATDATNLDDTEVEQGEEETPLHVALEARRVKTSRQDLPVETLYGWISRGKLNLQPDFQRYYVWNNIKSSRLIESLLMDVPIPVIYVAEDTNKQYVVVDGQQRLTAMQSYIAGKYPNDEPFKLTGLEVLTELNGKKFADLDEKLQEALLGAALRLTIIEEGSDPDVKFEVFKRLNLGAEKLNDQELRNCMYRGRYNDLLRNMAEENVYMSKILNSDRLHDRMIDRQLILRFLAMQRKTHWSYVRPIKRFLNREMEQHLDPGDRELKAMRMFFERTIEMVWNVFGQNAFRRFTPGREDNPNGAWEKHRLNIALWDVIMYTFSHMEKSRILPAAEAIREDFLDLITNDSSFYDYVTSTSDRPDLVRIYAETFHKRVEQVIASVGNGGRKFTLELKKKIYDAEPVCTVCGRLIREFDDATVHGVHLYWRDGKSIPNDARMSHRYCERARRMQPIF